jgi:hypothetical protein
MGGKCDVSDYCKIERSLESLHGTSGREASDSTGEWEDVDQTIIRPGYLGHHRRSVQGCGTQVLDLLLLFSCQYQSEFIHHCQNCCTISDHGKVLPDLACM